MTKEEAIFEYCTRIGDNAVILGHRLSEWTGHSPILEEDIALGNMSLDLIGQARGFLTYAGAVEGKGRSEDDLAYHRDAHQYKNKNINELPKGDFGFTMLRSFLFSSFAYLQFRDLVKSKDETISGLAEKALKEITYHVRHTSQWVIRLGDGTEESHQRINESLQELWSYTDELFEENDVDAFLQKEGISFSHKNLRLEWDKMIDEVFAKANLSKPVGGYQSKGGMLGLHTEHLGFILAEMQFLPRAYPDAIW
jgi:ring-1,2-phenylacetyl-CoA epoxidase subunit PaaC